VIFAPPQAAKKEKPNYATALYLTLTEHTERKLILSQHFKAGQSSSSSSRQGNALFALGSLRAAFVSSRGLPSVGLSRKTAARLRRKDRAFGLSPFAAPLAAARGESL
jgi:hypothetical protein